MNQLEQADEMTEQALSENRRNTLAHESDNIDLIALLMEQNLNPIEVLEQLISKKDFYLKLQPGAFYQKKIHDLFYNLKNIERKRGSRPFELAFPYVFVPDGNDGMKTFPLLIWEMDLSFSPQQTTTFLLSKSKRSEIRLNQDFVHYIKSNYDLNIEVIFKKFFSKGMINLKSVNRFCKKLHDSLPAMVFIDPLIQPVKFPTADLLEPHKNKELIFWSAVIGTFQRSFWNLLESTNFQDQDQVKDQPYPIGFSRLDPYQVTTLHSFYTEEIVSVEGRPGTGKSHLLNHHLVNVIANREKCVVVGKNMADLSRIQKGLNNLGLGAYSYLISVFDRDIKLMLDFVKSVIQTPDSIKNSIKADDWDLQIERYRRIERQLQKAYQATKEPLIGEKNRATLIGIFLKNQKKAGKELLENQLDVKEFRFDADEFDSLLTTVNKSLPLYRKIETLKHPLTSLNDAIFLEKHKEEAYRFLKESVDQFTLKSNRLQKRFIEAQSNYGDKLFQYYFELDKNLNAFLSQFKDLQSDAEHRFGDKFTLEKKSGIFAAFSKKQKQSRILKNDLEDIYFKLVGLFEKTKPFDFEFIAQNQKQSIASLGNELKVFEQKLSIWKIALPARIQDEIRRLNLKTIHPNLDYQEVLEDLEYDFNFFISGLNDAQLFNAVFENKMLTVAKSQEYLEYILEKIESVKKQLKDYPSFYDWQRFWLQQSGSAQHVIAALVNVKAKDWPSAFKSWYLNNILVVSNSKDIPNNFEQAWELSKLHKNLSAKFGDYLSSKYSEQRKEVIRSLKDLPRAQSAFFLSSKAKDSHLESDKLKAVFQTTFDEVTDLIPIFLVTPEAAKDLLAIDKLKRFNYVVLEGAREFEMIEAEKILELGHKKIFFSKKSSLDEIVVDKNVVDYYHPEKSSVRNLQICHEWRPGDLLTLVDKSIFIEDSAINYFKVIFEQIDGRYNALERINKEEGEFVLRLLNEIKETPQRTFPKVGIVCFTVEQRNYIWSSLQMIKQKNLPGADKIAQLERNGLGVFVLEDLRGEHFDTLVISSTFGAVDLKGTITKDIKELEGPRKRSLLFELMSKKYRDLYVVNSVPKHWLTGKKKKVNNLDAYLFANYLCYLRALSEGKAKTQEEIVNNLLNKLKIGTTKTSQAFDSFYDFVEDELKDLLPDYEIVRVYKSAQLQFPLALKSKHGTKDVFVVLADGFLASSEYTDFSWEIEKTKDLTKSNYHIVPTWSLNWWQNSRLAANALAEEITALDKKLMEISA